jgi:arabinosyltransferase C
MTEPTPENKHHIENRFVFLFAIAAAFIAALPAIVGWMGTPAGSAYLGFQYNTDDHMVYAAWMRQAMDGRLLMDNRFTTIQQPGLTIHLYFFLLGLVAKVVGISLAATLARIGFSVLFIFLLYRLVRKLEWNVYATKLALSLAVVGGGIGFLVWHTFGVEIVRPAPEILKSLMLGRLPTDVWQPEGFVLPSMLTNSLFMVSLCLIVYVFISFLEAKESWKPVLTGALAIGALMNIHSYDVLTVGLVMLGFLSASISQRQVDTRWLIRAAAITAGVLPAALWFVYVLRNDPVFQARAATETYSPNFRAVLFGYVLLMVLAIGGMVARAEENRARRLAGVGLVVVLLLGMFVAAAGHTQGYFMSLGVWALTAVVAVVSLFLLADERPAWNLIAAWAIMGTVALYFPGLFQRKLAMGLSIPWAILAAAGVERLLRRQERSSRNLATVLALVLLSASSARWLLREIELIKSNVSNTTVHPVYLNADARQIAAYLNRDPGRKVLIALPGQPAQPVESQTNQPFVDTFQTPMVPDLNPILSGLTGAYTVAGHWSETPGYNRRRGEVTSFFLSPGPLDEKRRQLEALGANYVVAPVPEAFAGADIPDLRPLGEVVVEGSQFSLIKVR